MLLTLPLVPVFMWLIGRYTAHRARERWQAMALLSGHFLDVVRGLPTLRAFNRGAAQAERVEAVSEEYRRATMGTLRVAFLSGAVLELAATLGVALIAVTVGVRLVDGSIDLEPALTVLVLAPELYLPIRNLAAQYHAGADGLAVSGRLLDLIDDAEAVPQGTLSAPSPRDVPVALEGVTVAYPGRPVPALERLQPGAGSGRDGGAGRAERRRQEHRRVAAAAVRRPVRRPGVRGRRRPRGLRRRGLARARGVGAAGPDTVPRHGRRQHRSGCARCDRRRRPRRGGAGGRRRLHPRAARRLRRRWSARRAAPCPPASASGSRSPVRSSGTRRWSSSTSRRPTSTPPAPSAWPRRSRGLDCTVLVITHDPRLASLADRVVRLDAAGAPIPVGAA